MEDYLKGWQDRKDVVIPPIEHPGFKEDVIVRKKIAPIIISPTKERSTAPAEEEYTGEDATTLLEKPLQRRAFIRRVNTAEEIEIHKSPFVIGKSVDCDYVIRDNTTISRRHAQVITTQEGYLLEDLGSSNHTFIENIQIDGAEKLKDKVEFQLSDEGFQFMLEIG